MRSLEGSSVSLYTRGFYARLRFRYASYTF